MIDLPTKTPAPIGLQQLCNQIHLLNDVVVMQLYLRIISHTQQQASIHALSTHIYNSISIEKQGKMTYIRVTLAILQ